MSMHHIPAGFTTIGASPGWYVRKPTKMSEALAKVREENAAAIARVQAEKDVVAAENAALQKRLDILMNRIEKLEANNGVEAS
jgi:hypothetical protein